MIPDEFRCVCGGTVPVPHQLFDPPSTTLAAICSDQCGRVWEFSYDDFGVFTGLSPQLAAESLIEPPLGNVG